MCPKVNSGPQWSTLVDACDAEAEPLVWAGWERTNSLLAGVFEGDQEVTSHRSRSESAPLHTYTPQDDQEIRTLNSSSPPRAEVMAYWSMPPLTLWPVWRAAAFPWLSSRSTRVCMPPLLLTPLGRYPAVLFWDSHVSACDRGMNGSFCSAGDKGRLQPPLETPRKTAIFLYSRLVSLEHNSVSGLMLRVT